MKRKQGMMEEEEAFQLKKRVKMTVEEVEKIFRGVLFGQQPNRRGEENEKCSERLYDALGERIQKKNSYIQTRLIVSQALLETISKQHQQEELPLHCEMQFWSLFIFPGILPHLELGLRLLAGDEKRWPLKFKRQTKELNRVFFTRKIKGQKRKTKKELAAEAKMETETEMTAKITAQSKSSGRHTIWYNVNQLQMKITLSIEPKM